MCIVWEGLKIPIVEMANTRSKVARDISHFADVIIEHLLKLYYLKDVCPLDVNGWEKSIMNKICKLPQFKGGKASKDFILSNTWGLKRNNFEKINKGFVKKFSYEYKVSLNAVNGEIGNCPYALCDEYFNWLADTLLKLRGTQELQIKDVIKVLGGLLKKYHYDESVEDSIIDFYLQENNEQFLRKLYWGGCL